MPDPNMVRFGLAIFIEPEAAEAFRESLKQKDVGNVLLDIERTIGKRLFLDSQGCNDMYASTSNVGSGEGVIEVYPTERPLSIGEQ